MTSRAKRSKFTAVVCLLLLPIILFGWLFVNQSLMDIALAQSELQGTQALVPAVQALHQTAIGKQVPGGLDALKSREWANLSLNSAITAFDRTSDAVVSTQRDRIAAASAVVSAIGDRSKLILDPDFDSYYTMNVVVLRVPEMLAHLGAMNISVNPKNITAVNDAEAEIGLALAGLRAASSGLQQSVQRAVASNPDQGTRASLLAATSNLSDNVETFYRVGHIIPGGNIINQRKFFEDRATSRAATNALATHILTYWSTANTELQRLLNQRIVVLQDRLSIALTSAGLVALTALLTAMSFFRGMLSRLDEEIIFLAHHDPLTGLSNRASLSIAIENAITASRQTAMPCAVHLIDLDRFKAINDTMGHAAGDDVIRMMAKRLAAIIGKNDVIGRLGGDEMVVLQRNASDAEAAGAMAEKIVVAMREPFICGEQTAQASASVGVAMAPANGQSTSELLVAADLALYAAKSGGRDRYHHFTQTLEAQAQARVSIEADIRRAVAEQSFDIEFQPHYDVSGAQLRGFEALLRLSDQTGKRISPAVFIPIAEQIGVITEIGTDVLQRACAFAVAWPEHLSLSVNLSPAQFRDGGLPGVVALALAKSKLSASRLTVEITEGLLLESTPQVLQQIDEIRQLGVSIAIDDFGTGYSNLAYLATHRFDKIKIDRSLIKGITAEKNSIKEVIRTIVNMGRSMNMVVVAEGVETQEQAAAMLDLNCHEIQGFLYGKPQPVTEVANTIMRARDLPKIAAPSTPRQRDFLELFRA